MSNHKIRLVKSVAPAIAMVFFGWVVLSYCYKYDWYSIGAPQFPVLPRKISKSDIRLSAISLEGQPLREASDFTFEAGKTVDLEGTAKLPHINYNISSSDDHTSMQIVNQNNVFPLKRVQPRFQRPMTNTRRNELRKLNKLSIRVRFERRACNASGSVVTSQQFFQIYTQKNGEIRWQFPVTVPKQIGVFRFVVDVIEHNELSAEFVPLSEFELKSVQFNCR